MKTARIMFHVKHGFVFSISGDYDINAYNSRGGEGGITCCEILPYEEYIGG